MVECLLATPLNVDPVLVVVAANITRQRTLPCAAATSKFVEGAAHQEEAHHGENFEGYNAIIPKTFSECVNAVKMWHGEIDAPAIRKKNRKNNEDI